MNMDNNVGWINLLPYMKFGVGLLDEPKGICIEPIEPVQEDGVVDIQRVQEEVYRACGVSEELLEGYKLIGVDLARDVADEVGVCGCRIAIVGHGGAGHSTLKEAILEIMRTKEMEVVVIDSLATMMEEKDKALELLATQYEPYPMEMLLDDCPKYLGQGNRAERRGQKERKTSYMSAEICPRGHKKTIKRKGHRR